MESVKSVDFNSYKGPVTLRFSKKSEPMWEIGTDGKALRLFRNRELSALEIGPENEDGTREFYNDFGRDNASYFCGKAVVGGHYRLLYFNSPATVNEILIDPRFPAKMSLSFPFKHYA